MSERKPGWYWISTGDFWEAAELFPSGKWVVTGSEAFRSEEDFQEVGPRIPTPDEPWQCVPDMPTPEMSQEGEENFGIPHDCDAKDCQSIYLAMIAAAPKPEDT